MSILPTFLFKEIIMDETTIYENGYQHALEKVKAFMTEASNQRQETLTASQRDTYRYILAELEESRVREDRTLELAEMIDDRSVTGGLT
jgi:nucleoside 2-deoxyribosyltransferase